MFQSATVRGNATFRVVTTRKVFYVNTLSAASRILDKRPHASVWERVAGRWERINLH